MTHLVHELRRLADAATPGPWYVRRVDDPSFMTAQYVTCEKGGGKLDVDAWDNPESVVAITLLQDPSLAFTNAEAENATFIAAARTGIPELCDELERALSDRAALADAMRQLLVTSPSGTSEHGNAIQRAERLLRELDVD